MRKYIILLFSVLISCVSFANEETKSTTVLFSFSGAAKPNNIYKNFERLALHLIIDQVALGNVSDFKITRNSASSIDICVTSYWWHTPSAKIAIAELESQILEMSNSEFFVYSPTYYDQKTCESISSAAHL